MRGVNMRLRADSSSRWRNLPAFSLVGGRILPVTGRIRTFLSLLASELFQCLDVLGRYWGCKRGDLFQWVGESPAEGLFCVRIVPAIGGLGRGEGCFPLRWIAEGMERMNETLDLKLNELSANTAEVTGTAGMVNTAEMAESPTAAEQSGTEQSGTGLDASCAEPTFRKARW